MKFVESKQGWATIMNNSPSEAENNEDEDSDDEGWSNRGQSRGRVN